MATRILYGIVHTDLLADDSYTLSGSGNFGKPDYSCIGMLVFVLQFCFFMWYEWEATLCLADLYCPSFHSFY